jgi:hypothetical protein
MARVVHGASRPGGDPPGQDRWTATDAGIVVLDGASAFDPDAPPADAYVDALLPALAQRLDTDAALTAVMGEAIADVADHLQLVAGDGPSSTVLLLRHSGNITELAVLGDSTIVVGFRDRHTERISDTRISAVAPAERRAYRELLRHGYGYGPEHREFLRQIQKAEQAARNTADGYWIAEAQPAAAGHAVHRSYVASDIAWCILATDGAQRGLDHQGADWAALPGESNEELRARLDDLHSWENDCDPNGRHLPRAKRHDDKTLVTSTYYP